MSMKSLVALNFDINKSATLALIDAKEDLTSATTGLYVKSYFTPFYQRRLLFTRASSVRAQLLATQEIF